jgi:hypothetical protein
MSLQEEDVQAINLGRMLAMMGCGETCPITRLFDHDGDETDDPEEAVSFICGPTPGGKWITDLVADYDNARTVN